MRKTKEGYWIGTDGTRKFKAFGFVLFMILIFIGIVLFIPVRKKTNDNKIYRNESLVIVGTNEGTEITQNKFHKPISVKTWLVRRVTDTTQFAELSSHDRGFAITTDLWYNKKMGDTLHFDYILRRRFFTIDK